MTLAGCVAAGFFLGRFLDGRLGTNPWLTVILAFVGAGAAFKVLYDLAKDWE